MEQESINTEMTLEGKLRDEMKVKILNYNILYGFHTYTENPVHQPGRQEAIKRVVREYNPDILILNEANFLPGNKWGIEIDYQKILGKDRFPHMARTDNPEYGEWSTAVLSKHPFSHENRTNSKGRNMRTSIDLGNAKTLMLDAVHPNPIGKEEYFLTADETATFLSEAIEGMEGPYVLAGDFNALSPEDSYNEKNLLSGYKTFCKTEEDAKWLVNQQMSFTPLRAVLDEGLIDTYKKIHVNGFDHTMPTKIGGSTDSASRIDYIFTSPEIEVIDSGIIKNADTDMASDHYPVYAELNI